MMKIKITIVLLLVSFLGLAQKKLDAKLIFNTTANQYEVFVTPNFSQNNFLLEPSQIPISLPSLVTNQPFTINSHTSFSWNDEVVLYQPSEYPNNDLHGIETNGGTLNFVEDQDVLLFSFSLNEGYVDSVSLFNDHSTNNSTLAGKSNNISDTGNQTFAINELTCNTYTPMIQSNFTNLTVNSSFLGFGSTNNVIDNNLTNNSSWSYLIGGSAFLEVADGLNTYPSGTYAGFVLDQGSIDILGNVTVSTYMNNTVQQSVSSSSLLNLLNSEGNARIGFVATLPFNKVRISFSALGVAGTRRIYYAELLQTCAGSAPACNTQTALSLPNYPALIENAHTGVTGVSVLASVTNTDNVVSPNTNDFATISLPLGILSTGSIAVKDYQTVYPAGYYAGFEISNQSLIGVQLFNSSTIRTYLNGVLQETRGGNALLISLPILSGSGRQIAGFITTLPFNEIQYTINQPVGINIGNTDVFNAVIKQFCQGPDSVCNIPTLIQEPQYPITINVERTGISSLACVGCNVSNVSNIIDTNTTNFASITLVGGIVSSGSIAVKNGFSDFELGTFAGFDIRNPNLLSVNLLNNITINTYKNGVLVESATQSNGALASVNTSLLNGSGTQRVGFLTTLPYDEFQITLNQLVSVDLGTTEVYNVVVQKFCDATLACNELVSFVAPLNPAYIDIKNTGITSLACVACQLNNTENIINADTDDFATLILAAGVGSSGNIAVGVGTGTDFPENSFAGFDISNPSLLNANVLGGITITLLNNGIEVQSGSGIGQLVTLGTSLLTATDRSTVGIVSNVPFDEVKLTISNLVAVDLGAFNIYNAVIQKTCPVIIICNDTYNLSTPEFPVIVEGTRTGIESLVCVACAVNDRGNVVSADPADFARISLVAGVAATGSISVRDLGSVYPVGTTAGFVVNDPNGFLQVAVLDAIVITTYLDGVEQESRTGGNLIQLNAILPWIGVQPGFRNIGIVTTLPWNEVRITYLGLATVLNYIDVYSAFVNTSSIPAGTPGFDCAQIVNLKAFLQGSMFETASNDLMRDDLRLQNLIPLMEPYTDFGNTNLRFQRNDFVTNETTTTEVLSKVGNDAIVDWVFVELRDPDDKSIVLHTKSALIQRDGDVVDSNFGDTFLSLYNLDKTSYYIAIKHRNHLGVMTANPIPIIGGVLSFDFTVNNGAALYNLDPMYEGFEQNDLLNGKFALWAGNCNVDNKVKYSGLLNDQSAIFNKIINTEGNVFSNYNYDLLRPVYFNEDVNMDGKVKYRGVFNDSNYIFFNLITNYNVLNTMNFYNYDLFKEQIPN